MDIDIDLANPEEAIKLFPQIVKASRIHDGEIKKHPAGVYFQHIPMDHISSLSSVPYKEAELLGFTKIDMLHLSLLEKFKTKDQIRKLSVIEPNWNLLKDKEIVIQLFQIRNHFDIIDKIKPKSIEELADAIALIRPGKRNLINKYIINKENTRKELYAINKNEKYSFKRSHSIAYATTIVLQLHLIQGEKNAFK